MDVQEAEQRIISSVLVTRQNVALMKGLMLKNFHPNVRAMYETALKKLSALPIPAKWS
jgi:hypothetical protein